MLGIFTPFTYEETGHRGTYLNFNGVTGVGGWSWIRAKPVPSLLGKCLSNGAPVAGELASTW